MFDHGLCVHLIRIALIEEIALPGMDWDFWDYGCNTKEKLYNTWPYIYNTHGHGHGHLSQMRFSLK